MHFQFVTYRWAEDLTGGAELHHRRLATELRDLGHKVSVLTTDGHDMWNFCHWAVMWNGMTDKDDEFNVKRFTLRRRPKWFQALDAKRLQAHFEREESAVSEKLLSRLLKPAPNDKLFCMTGWHYPEVDGATVHRWTHGIARIGVKLSYPAKGELVIRGSAAKKNRVHLSAGELQLGTRDVAPGNFELRFPVKIAGQAILVLSCERVWRPLQDFRGLGLRVREIALEREGGAPIVDRTLEDYRALGRLSPGVWQSFLMRRAKRRPATFNRMIDRLRGPKSRPLARAIRDAKADHVIHCNMPWANMSLVRKGDLAMPLWHLEDEFYYWRHWIEGLKRARFVLANTPYSARSFFPKIGIDAHFVGPPIWEPTEFPGTEEKLAFRAQHNIAENEILVLTVCRKSGEKRYETIGDAVQKLRGEGVAIRMIGIGPDADGRPFEYDGCRWLGRMSAEDLQLAYAACDVFAFMSESESFGMVIPEAWHHGKPVIVNRTCGPAASLVSDGRDGVLATPGASLVEALRELAKSPEKRRAMGEAGRTKARKHFVRGAAAARLIEALENLK